MSGPFRLPRSAGARFGARIDRDEPVGFRFAGRALSGLYGDTLASALLAAGAPRWATSPTLGRPRALAALGLEDHVPVVIEDDAGDWAAISGDEIVIREGMAARPVRLAPSTSVGGMIRRVAVERLRRVLPLPHMRLPATRPLPSAIEESCDVVVIGSGSAGVAAVTALRRTGLHVMIVEASRRPCGTSDLFDAVVAERALGDWTARAAAAFADRDALRLGATVIDIEPGPAVVAIERSDPRRPGEVVVRRISAGAVVLATGFRERPLVFRDNDRPGIVGSQAARALLRRHAVAPGEKVVVATLSDDGYRTAIDLKEAGVSVEMTLDGRDDPRGAIVDEAKALGVPLAFSSVVTGVDYDEGSGRITGVRAANRTGDGVAAAARSIEADALVVAGGFAARDELARRSGLRPEHGLFTAFGGAGVADAIASGWRAGLAAASHLFAVTEEQQPEVQALSDEADGPVGAYLARLGAEDAESAFIDFGAEITAADIGAGVALGADGPEALSRLLGLGSGLDCGRFSADLPAHAFAAAGARGAPAPLKAARLTLGLLAARATLK
jgi:sarcosine oxidase subunit alpha